MIAWLMLLFDTIEGTTVSLMVIRFLTAFAASFTTTSNFIWI